MADLDLLAFQWPCHKSGYRWVGPETEEIGKRLKGKLTRGEAFKLPVTEIAPTDPSQGTRNYAPLTDAPQLFREFASLSDPGEDDFANFADRFGLLFGRSRWPSGELAAVPYPNERLNTFKAWKEEWFLLSEAVKTLDAARQRESRVWPRAGAKKGLGRRASAVEWSALLGGSLGRRQVLRSIGALYESGVPAGPELSFNMGLMLINEHLAGDAGSSPVQVQVVHRPTSEAVFALRIVPSDLAAAMWLQLARELTERLEYRDCLFCRKPFEVSARGRRKSARFCSQKCQIAKWKEENPNGRAIKPKRQHARRTASRRKV